MPTPVGPTMSDGLVLVHPVRLGEGEDLGAVEPAGTAEVDVLDRGRGAELRGLQAAFQPPVAAGGELAVDEQAEALLEGEPGVGGLLALVGEAWRPWRAAAGSSVPRWWCSAASRVLSCVVAGAADVVVGRVGCGSGACLGQGLSVEGVRQDRLDASIGVESAGAAPGRRPPRPARCRSARPRRMMPRAERKPCSGWGREERIASTRRRWTARSSRPSR